MEINDKKFNLVVFGSTTNIGKDFNKKYSNYFNIIKISREIKKDFISFDLNNPNKFNFPKESFGIISFAPIWVFSDFLEYFSINNIERIKKLVFVISLSSTSVLTKKFSANEYDINLSKKLIDSENKLSRSLAMLSIKNLIIRPTIIYGDLKNNNDKNLSVIIRLMRNLPIVFLPKRSGLRQPIHYSQLSKVTFYFVRKLMKKKENNYKFHGEIINLGGDEELSYESMIRKILNNLEPIDRARKCRILKIPNRAYTFLLSPLILFSPNIYFAFQRICVNLSGFQKVFEVISSKPKNFPLK